LFSKGQAAQFGQVIDGLDLKQGCSRHGIS
jgi:hypothetical protein